MFKTPSKNKPQQHQPAHHQKETLQNKNEPATRGTQPSLKGTPTTRLHNLASNHTKCCPTKRPAHYTYFDMIIPGTSLAP